MDLGLVLGLEVGIEIRVRGRARGRARAQWAFGRPPALESNLTIIYAYLRLFTVIQFVPTVT